MRLSRAASNRGTRGHSAPTSVSSDRVTTISDISGGSTELPDCILTVGSGVAVDAERRALRAFRGPLLGAGWLPFDRLAGTDLSGRPTAGPPVPGSPIAVVRQDGTHLDLGTFIGRTTEPSGPWAVVELGGNDVMTDAEGFVQPTIEGARELLAYLLNLGTAEPAKTDQSWKVEDPQGQEVTGARDPFHQRTLILGTVAAVGRAARALSALRPALAFNAAHALSGARRWSTPSPSRIHADDPRLRVAGAGLDHRRLSDAGVRALLSVVCEVADGGVPWGDVGHRMLLDRSRRS